MEKLISGKNRVLLVALAFVCVQLNAQQQLKDSSEVIHESIITSYRSYLKRPETGLIVLTSDKLKKMASILGENDIMRSIQRLPGSTSTREGYSGIIVRGGEYDQNLVIIDRMTLYNSEHLGGFVSSINPNIIENIDFYRGYIPVQFGGRLSSALNMGIKEGDFHQFHGQFGIGILSSNFSLEGPMSKSGKTSFLFGGRVSYFNKLAGRVMKRVYDDTTSLRPVLNMDFYDFNAKIVNKISPNDRLEAVFYRSIDKQSAAPTPIGYDYHTDLNDLFRKGTEEFHPYDEFDYLLNNSYLESEALSSSWGNNAGGITWKHSKRESINLNSSLNYVDYSYSASRKELNNHIKDYARYTPYEGVNESVIYRDLSLDSLRISDDYRIRHVSFSTNIWANLSTAHKFAIGTEAIFSSLDSKQTTFRRLARQTIWEDMVSESLTDYKKDSNNSFGQINVFVNEEWNVSDKLSALIGARESMFFLKEKNWSVFEPRLSFSYSFNKSSVVKLSWSKTSQGIHLVQDNGIFSISDRWICITEDIRPMTSEIASIGLYKSFPKDWVLSLEGYYKTMHNMLDYKEGSSITSIEWENNIVRGSGKAYGVEFLGEKHLGKTSGWLSYSWSKSFRTFNEEGNELNAGNRFYASSDLRHNLNIVVKQDLWSHLSLSVSFTFKTGHRATLPLIATYGPRINEANYIEIGNNHLIEWYYTEPTTTYVMPERSEESITSLQRFLIADNLNNYVMPSIHRLDLGCNYSFKTGKVSHRLNLSVCNVYNRMNISYVFWGKENDYPVLRGICIFPIMPSISYNLSL